MECQDHGGYAVNVFSICVVSPSFSKYLLGTFSLLGALWAVGCSSECEDNPAPWSQDSKEGGTA